MAKCSNTCARVIKMTENEKHLYSAFISYRHADPDQIIARRIQRSIETFNIPHVYRDQSGSKHFRKVFRDTDELSLDKDLASGIDNALAQSEYLIVILTPQYKESQWCLHEIDEFLKTHDRKNILCVLAEGEPGDVLPESLTHIPSKENPDEIIIREPLCADYRLDRVTAERLELPRLLSSMLSCDYDNLVQRQEVYRRKGYMRIGSGILIALAVVIFLQTRNMISLNKAYQDTTYNRFQTLAAQSLHHLSEFNRAEALTLSLLALPGEGMPVTAEAIHSLSKATYLYQPDALSLIRNHSMQDEIIMRQVSEDQSLIVTLDSSGWILVQSADGKRLSYWQIDGTDNHYLGFILKDNDTVIAWRGSNLYSYDFRKYDRNWCVRIPGGYENTGIISVGFVDDSTCSVLTDRRIAFMDLNSGKMIRQIGADSIAFKYQDNSPDGQRDRKPPRVRLYRQLISGNEIFVSGSLTASDASKNQEKEILCLAAWDLTDFALRVRTYSLPSYCLQLQPARTDHLVAVTAEQRFDPSKVIRLVKEYDETLFSRVQILCLDRESLELNWNYDTEVVQSTSIPQIDILGPEEGSTEAYVSVVFDVDNYVFDIKNGSCTFSLTLPDSILLTWISHDDHGYFLSYLCGNQKLYIVYPSEGVVSENVGITPFPDAVQAVSIVDGKYVAFSGRHIYWFGMVDNSNRLGEVLLKSDEDDLEFFDAGDNLLGSYSNKTLFLTDVRSGNIVQEVSLRGAAGSDYSYDWKYGGSLPDGSGFLMLCKNERSGQVRLFTYDMQNNEFTLYDTILNKASFSKDVSWIDSFACHDGILYTVDPEEDNTLMYFDIVNRTTGRIPVTGIPSSMKLAEAYYDYVNEYEMNEATLVISSDGKRVLTTLCDPAAKEGAFAVIDLETGECSIPKVEEAYPGRSHSGAFSEDGRLLACSTDYAIYILDEEYSMYEKISTSGANIRSMTWYEGDLWIELSNNTVQRYNKDDRAVTIIDLDYAEVPDNGQDPQWVVNNFPPLKGIMLIDRGNMNLLSAEKKAGVPILHIPGFVGWNNESDTFVVRSYRAVRSNVDYMQYSHVFYIYPHYTTEELIDIGLKQYNEMVRGQQD